MVLSGLGIKMASWLLVLTLCCIIHTPIVLTLMCNNCNMDCDNPTNEQCLEPGQSQDVACLLEIFTDIRNDTYYQTKCVLFDKGSEFECADYPGYKSKKCVICSRDLCNKIPTRLTPDIKNTNLTVTKLGTLIGINFTHFNSSQNDVFYNMV